MHNLITESGKMICPRCEEPQDILTFARLQHSEKYDKLTIPIYKCRLCRFVFAPEPDLLGSEIGH